MKLSLIIKIWLILTLIGPLWVLITGRVDLTADWRTANRASAQIAPLPEKHPEAIIQVYTARAFSWRGLFASHNWLAIKPKNAKKFTVYQVIGWRQFWNLPPLSREEDIPDRNWFGQKPKIILDMRGEQAEKLIPTIKAAANKYPYANLYKIWPGPNSNTFPAFIGREVPALSLTLPSDSIGKDFLSGFTFFARAPSGTGYQFSLFGILGLLIAKKEGIELNILGFVYGLKFSPLAIELPGIGPIPAGRGAQSSL